MKCISIKLGLIAASLFSGAAAHAADYQYRVHHWKQGEGQVSLGSSRDRICFLSKVQGKFEGWGEAVWVKEVGATYYLGGKSNQDNVAAIATCVTNPKGNYDVQYDTWSQGQSDIYLGDRNNVCFLTGMSGKFEGWAESIGIKNYSYGTYLGGTSNQHSVEAQAGCVARSYPDLKSYTWNQGESQKILASAKTHVCYLTKISGKFKGSGEAVQVVQNGGYWILSGKSQQHSVTATATCTTKI
ncbi:MULTISPECIES: hypothetical protein [Pseudoalteromonas]|uniref:Lectin n=1 Tax=Pseudoalteromonas rubra TaxID=43658 RepID=A0A5S3X0S8_9GAMM|nr:MULTISPECIES: hypothetical protein [Pseudoalteromonas]AZZ96950.1 hypothetical protein ELR70_07185 [Pseudoalteromonas sp. R3]TMP37788.1 hypothetical protein CWB98_09450 [Pseudoalteromonas rubra]